MAGQNMYTTTSGTVWRLYFANLESFAKFIQRKFEPLHCNTHGQHEFAKFIQRIPSKQLLAKI